MGFRGIDPDGLCDLGLTVLHTTERAAAMVRPGLDVFHRHGISAAPLSEAIDGMAKWGRDIATNLCRRAELIRRLEDEGAGVWDRLRTGYVLAATLSVESLHGRQESRQSIQRAVADITRWLDQRWNDWDVTNSDLHNIVAALSGLSRFELNRVLAGLSPGQLERWVAEMSHSLNGFSRDEKRAAFSLLAAGADGIQLARIHEALIQGGCEDDLVVLGTAVRYHSPDQVILDFVRSATSRYLHGHRFSTLAPSLAVSGIEEGVVAATAIAAILAAKDALETTIIDAAISFDPDVPIADPLSSLVSAAANAASPAVSARLFAFIADAVARPGADRHTLEEKDGSEARDIVGEDRRRVVLAAAELLASDPHGIITELATNVDPDGSTMSGFLHLLVARELHDHLGQIAAELRGDVEVDPVRFGWIGDNPAYPYPYAQNLAYFAASLSNGLQRYAEQAQSTVTTISVLAALAMTVVGIPYGAIEGSVGAVLDMAGICVDTLTNSAVQQDIDDQLASLIAKVESSFRPTGADVSIPGAAWESWTVQLARIRSFG